MEESITFYSESIFLENDYRFQVDEDNFVSNDDDKASP